MPYLSPIAEIEARLNLHRTTTRLMSDALATAAHHEVFKGEFDRANKLAAKLSYCAYGQRIRRVTQLDGTTRLECGNRYACRLKQCPSCEAKRSRKECRKALAMLNEACRRDPTLRGIFLTLTLRNAALSETKMTLDAHDAALTRFWRVSAVKAVVAGQIGNIEMVLRGTWDAPEIGVHSHHLILVRPDYFTGPTYLTKNAWQAAWQTAARLSYKPIVWVNVPGARDGRNTEAVRRTMREVVKYCVAPQSILDIVDHVPTRAHVPAILTLAEATHKRRFLRFNGVFATAAKALRSRQGGAA